MVSLHVEPAAAARAGRTGASALLCAVTALAALVLASAVSAAPAAGCSFCGKNLVLNPGAESGKGLTATGANGAVPHWTNTQGQFGAAAYSGFGRRLVLGQLEGARGQGQNYFFGGTTTAATSAKASIGSQTIKLPAGSVGHKATLSGWLGNYGSNTASVRATFTDASGKTLTGSGSGPTRRSAAGTWDFARARARFRPEPPA